MIYLTEGEITACHGPQAILGQFTLALKKNGAGGAGEWCAGGGQQC